MKSILIAEDDASLREMYTDKFLQEKFDVITAFEDNFWYNGEGTRIENTIQ